MRRGVLVALALVLLLLGTASPAGAHAYLVRTDPGDGATVHSAPHELRLFFSEHVVLAATRVEVVAGSGRVVPVTGLRLSTRDATDTETPSVVVVPLPRLGADSYRVTWETLSSDDLHRTAGVFVFGVASPVTAAGSTEPLPRPEEATLRWLLLAGLCLALGGPLAARTLRSAGTPRAVRRVRLLALGGAGLAAVASALLLADQLAQGGLTLGELAHTGYRDRWLLREAGLLLLVGATSLGLRGHRPRLVRTLHLSGAALGCAGVALLGHAGAGGGLGSSRVLATAAHVAAATTWAGAVACLAVALGLGRHTRTLPVGSVRTALRAFAWPAAACLSVAVVSGVYLASDVVGSVDAALRTFYGKTLLLKVGLVGVMAALALVNHLRLRGRSDLDLPRGTVRAEAVGALLVVVATAVLTSAQPATGPGLVSPAPATRGPVSREVADLQESVNVSPNRPGPNVAVVDVFDSRRPSPGPVTAVVVRIPGRPATRATPLPDGHWSANLADVPAGATRLHVTVQRAGLPAVAAGYAWTVGDDVARPRPLVSTAPIAGPLRGAAGVLAGLAAVAWLLAVRRRIRSRRAAPPSADDPPDGDRAGRGTTLVATSTALVAVLAGVGLRGPAPAPDPAGAAPVAATLAAARAPGEAPGRPVDLAVGSAPAAPTATVGAAPPAAVVVTSVGQSELTRSTEPVSRVLLAAYQAAVAGSPASCHLPVGLLAAIGQVESGSLAGLPLDARHRTDVLGPVLDGHGGFQAVPDTDHGRLDGDRRWDRAVGPMQFLPATWQTYGRDGDGDGVADPQDVEDASAATAAYLCSGGRDLAVPAQLRAAVLAYNHSVSYLYLVQQLAARWAGLAVPVVAGPPGSLLLVADPMVPARGGGSTPVRTSTRPARHAAAAVQGPSRPVGTLQAGPAAPAALAILTTPSPTGPPVAAPGGSPTPTPPPTSTPTSTPAPVPPPVDASCPPWPTPLPGDATTSPDPAPEPAGPSPVPTVVPSMLPTMLPTVAAAPEPSASSTPTAGPTTDLPDPTGCAVPAAPTPTLSPGAP